MQLWKALLSKKLLVSEVELLDEETARITFDNHPSASGAMAEFIRHPEDPPFIRIRDEGIDRDLPIEIDTVQATKAIGTREWPPTFELGGAEYVLDSRSGQFYHSRTGFFYDPGSKLYFDTQSGKYHKFEDGVGGGYVEVGASAGGEETKKKDVERKGISMTIKKVKNKPKRKAAEVDMQMTQPIKPQPDVPDNNEPPKRTDDTLTSAPLSQRISHWTKKTTELNSPDAPPNHTIRFVCYVCRRKFRSDEMLKRHESESELHRSNLAKGTYRDRAAELKQQSSVKPKAKEEEGLGMKMLKKMGWKPGEDGEAIQGLRKEWDRVEGQMKKVRR